MSVGYGDRPLTTAFYNFLQTFNKGNQKMIKYTLKELYGRIEERLAAAYARNTTVRSLTFPCTLQRNI